MKLDRYTEKAQEAILAAQRLATEAESPLLDAEHILAALLEDPEGIPAVTLRRLVFSYQRSAFDKSLPFVALRKSESALHNTIVSSSAWLVPCARVGGIVCAASPSNVSGP